MTRVIHIFLVSVFFSSLLLSSNVGFTPNMGQLADLEGNKVKDVIFYASGKNFKIFVKDGGVSYVIYKIEGKSEGELKFRFKDANNPDRAKLDYARIDIDFVDATKIWNDIEFIKPISGYTNYYYAHCPEGILFVPTYEEVKIKGIYPGIDWIWKYVDGVVHHEFVVKSGFDIGQIKFKVKYADVEVVDGKEIYLKTPIGEIKDGELFAYEISSGAKVDLRYKIEGEEVKFEAKEKINGSIVIDPPLSLIWSTYYGGNWRDDGNSITTDLNGNVYIAGVTQSDIFPTYDPEGFDDYFQGTHAGAIDDAFILKFNNSGVRQWATYYGGNGNDYAFSSATDSLGNVFVTGATLSRNFPTYNPRNGAFYQGNLGGIFTYPDVFILKFDKNGIRKWATYYGGSAGEYGYSITVHASTGIVFVTGYTASEDFPTYNPGISGVYYQPNIAGGSDAFILQFTNIGVIKWATYYGGNYGEVGYAITTDKFENVLLTGYTNSTDFPLYNPGNAYIQNMLKGNIDAFISKFSISGVRQWATYYGGNMTDVGYSIVTDDNGNIFVAGETNSTDFPVYNPGGGAYFQDTLGTYPSFSYEDVFILKFNSSGQRMWATYYGGEQTDWSPSITTDLNGNVYVTGATQSNILPTRCLLADSYCQDRPAAGTDIFILGFNNYGVRFWATYFGGAVNEGGSSITTDLRGNIFVTGWVNSTASNYIPFPTRNPEGGAYFQPDNNTIGWGNDAFILKFEGLPRDFVVSVQDGKNDFAIPDKFVLYQNYPNPFNPQTEIKFDLPESGHVKIEVYNLLGQRVAVLYDGYMEAGYNKTVKWYTKEMPSGIYFYRVTTGKYVEVKKMVLMK
ncbi:MAG: SBBP repeat-containing protein [Candidatus Kryptonium sp.]|nr:SBBP repeat-containing protein [Candidatus Kryptonium sp.]